uniref:4-hydroxy-3-methylbut-2-enyl diphosphate reductase, chloroplastic n=1 Tax=Botryococcus braunii TaxID=38881 RepID=ISPH_BOTBR|nr:RecName: Full=4-hydroxy-3-methylbut-2-enyl diphosphate reductase, chloroplastic; Short=BbHDR; Flags: Precursor [Botryococcus braunii]BBB76027.1 4-hydroxy-3-methylbut-2-enyl diphosphate reductase [Botryococcus braunii]BBB76028.1 4-hydroxy-3-methylbut-2-enyl diphosphate reductase [Botryococcus braunii]|eukprot:jgi/Botrbrau1/21840/Bobra.0190s0054.1
MQVLPQTRVQGVPSGRNLSCSKAVGGTPLRALTRDVVRPARSVNVHVVADGESADDVLLRSSSVAVAEKPKVSGRAFRRSLKDTGRYVAKPINDKDSLDLMEEHGVGYSSVGLVAQMRANNNEWRFKDIRVKLASAYGYCWGVERAVQMAYEAKKKYPDRQIHLTNEIIHNPTVNERMTEMDINIIEQKENGSKDFSKVSRQDVVILPAFGASVQELSLLKDLEVQIVDTTCPWVSKVWTAVDNQARKAHTSVIHGKYSHEETIATASFAETYLIVRDIEEANYVCNYILNGGNKEEFLTKFKNAISKGFDPDRDLARVGLANQTTMLRDETMAIGKLLEKTMIQKHGPAAIKEHFMVMDTICDATQERQDAVYQLVGQQDNPAEKLDLILVVGGFNSSNTSHLQEIPELKNIPSFWVNEAACIDPVNKKITHRTAHGTMLDTQNWLPDGPVTIGVTSGASTPDRAVEEVLEAVFKTRDASFGGIAPNYDLGTAPVVRHEEH